MRGARPSQYDLRLSRYFGTSPGLWLRLQLDFELMRAERQSGELITAKYIHMRLETEFTKGK